MKIKTFLPLMICVANLFAAPQTVQIIGADSSSVVPTVITLTQGEVLKFHYIADDILLDMAINPATGFGAGLQSFTISKSGTLPLIAGPALIRFKGAVIVNNGMFRAALVTYEKLVSDITSQNYLPNTAIVIPSNASGLFDVSLERSSDLISWTSVNPGTYSPTSAGQFFRARIIQR